MTWPSAYRIEQAMSAWQSARARMIADDPELEAELATAELATAEGDVRAILAAALRAAVDAADMATAARERAAFIKAREARFKARADALRGVCFAILDAMGERKVVLPDLTASISRGRPVLVITDPDALPDDLVNVEVTRVPRRVAIAEAMQADGVVVPGCEWSNGASSLQIRTK